jgi:hypothetical protein
MSLFESGGSATLFISADSATSGVLLVNYPTSSSPLSYIYEENSNF